MLGSYVHNAGVRQNAGALHNDGLVHVMLGSDSSPNAGTSRCQAEIEGERSEHADPQGPSSTRNQHNSQNGGRQETIGHCLIRQWPIVLDAVMVGFWPFSLTVLTIFSSPSVSPLPPPLNSEVHPSAPPRHGGPRARPHPGPGPLSLCADPPGPRILMYPTQMH